jgi:transposase
MKVKTKEVRAVTKILDDIIKEYKEEGVQKKRDWRTYEQQLAERIKHAVRSLEPLIDEAISTLKIVESETRGRKPDLALKQKTILLLLQRLFGRSNREMSAMLVMFSLLTGVDVSYKSIERLYSDEKVIMVLHNLHMLILKKKGVKNSRASGDGTGYSLSVKKHYASYAKKLKEKAKKNKKKSNKKKQFVFSFKLLDLDTNMYLTYGTSLKSENEAFNQAIKMAETTVDSIRLDRYYSKQAYVQILDDKFNGIKLYLIPRSDATIKGPWQWKRMLHKFVNNTKEYLKEYYQRNHSENAFSTDKKRLGWKIRQQREDRIDTADFCTLIWHNLFWLKN